MQHVQKLESLGVLAGGIAHDLNNALGAIMGHASLALSKLPHGAAPRNLGAVLDAAERAAALSRRLLAFSGHGAFELRRLELRAFVAESQPLLQAAVATPIRLEIDLGADALPLDADPAQLGQALLELVQNAVEAITPRPGIIRVATRLRQVDAEGADTVGATGSPLSPGRYACLLVEDDGGGIEPEVLGRIFDPFFSTRFTGRGLGLPAVLGIARSHRGDVAVASTPGAGSRFELLLPAAKPVAAAAAPTPAPTGRGVLVVDDEPALREVVIETLNAEGIPAWGAADGPQALRMIDEMKDAIAVVMLDLSPPGARGEETLRALRNRGADAKVLLTSGHTESALPALPRARPDAFLQKPYHTKALLEAIRSLLGAPPTTSPSS
jgi:CheY-like chemotaxis protein/two-component sensor histidine kinase